MEWQSVGTVQHAIERYTVQDISLQSAGCLQCTEKNSQKMSKISAKAIVHRVSDLTLHYTLSEIVVYLYVTKNMKCFMLLTSRSCLTFCLEYSMCLPLGQTFIAHNPPWGNTRTPR